MAQRHVQEENAALFVNLIITLIPTEISVYTNIVLMLHQLGVAEQHVADVNKNVQEADQKQVCAEMVLFVMNFLILSIDILN